MDRWMGDLRCRVCVEHPHSQLLCSHENKGQDCGPRPLRPHAAQPSEYSSENRWPWTYWGHTTIHIYIKKLIIISYVCCVECTYLQCMQQTAEGRISFMYRSAVMSCGRNRCSVMCSLEHAIKVCKSSHLECLSVTQVQQSFVNVNIIWVIWWQWQL